MLRFLSIKNLAVIESAELEFDAGLTVLTGETGAGKSILVEAVGLLLGERASNDLVRTGEDTAVVQAVIDDVQSGEEIIVRREVTSQGRSRAFVNGALVTAASLREFGARLVDLHGQHEHQALLDTETHLDLLDRFASLEPLRQETADAFAAVERCRADLEAVKRQAEQRAARTELVEFQLGELKRAELKAGEDEELASLKLLLSSAEKVRRLCEEGYAILYDQDESALAALGQVWRRVGELAALEPRFQPYLEARDTIKPQLEDLATLLRSYGAGIDASPARLQEVEDRLALLERLKRKHGPTLADVIAKRDVLTRELLSLGSVGERQTEAQQALESAGTTYLAVARRLSAARRAAASRFAKALVAQLGELAMEQTRFEVRFDGNACGPDTWSSRGIDIAQFYISPNPGEELRPLARIVSGGEMSRVMLAIKSLASLDQPGKTLIFDEVDAGIGGRVADAVGLKLRALGGPFQVLCITHLPQIAAYGTRHYRIQKEIRQGRTITSVQRLDRRGREGELARMIGGADVSPAAKASAVEMLASRQGESESETRAKAKAASRVQG